MRVGGWTVHPDRNELARKGRIVRIEPMTMRLLCLLIENHGRTVTRDEIVTCLWQGRIVSEDAITKQISKLRAALGDDPRAPAIVKTVPKIGVRLVAAPESAIVQTMPVRPARQILWAAGAAFLAGLGVLLLLLRSGSVEPPLRLSQIPLTTAPGLEFDPALSRDGNWLAYAARPEGGGPATLYVRQVADEAARPATPPGWDASSPAWSPAGRLAFVASPEGRCTVMAGPALGPYRPIQRCVSTLGLAWAGENRLIVAAHTGVGRPFRLWAVNLRNGGSEPLTTPPAGALGDRSPVVVGDKVYFARSQTVGIEHLLELDLATRGLRIVSRESANIIGLAGGGSGRLLVASNRGEGTMALWQVGLSDGAWRQILPEIDGRPTASGDGRSIVLPQTERRQVLWSRPLDGGAGRPLTSSTQADWLPVASATGALAFLSDRTGARELWVLSGDGEARRLTQFGGPQLQDPAWSPDGRTVAIAVPERGNFDLFFVNASNGVVRRITSDAADERHPSFSPDGRTLYFARRAGARYDLVRRDLATSREERVIENGLRSMPSADGRRLYFGRLLAPGLFEVELASGRVRRIAGWPDWDNMRNWTVAADRLWGIAEGRLLGLDPERGSVRDAGALSDIAVSSGLAVSGGNAVYSRTLEVRSDLVLLRVADGG